MIHINTDILRCDVLVEILRMKRLDIDIKIVLVRGVYDRHHQWQHRQIRLP